MTNSNDKEAERGAPVKMTILYEDGSEEESLIFMAVLARDVIPISKIDDQIFYMGDGDKFTAGSVCNVAATTDIVGTLLCALSELGMSILESAADNPGALIDLLRTMTARTKSTDHHSSASVHEIRPEDN